MFTELVATVTAQNKAEKELVQSDGFKCLKGVTQENAADAFGNLDIDGNGFVSAEELRSVLVTLGYVKEDDDEMEVDDLVDEMIRMADFDGIGQVSLEGYLNLIQTPAMIAEMQTQRPGQKKKKKKGEEEEVAEEDARSRALMHAVNLMTNMNEKRVGASAKMKRGKRHANALAKEKAGGKIKPAALKKIIEQFKLIDTDNSGELTYEEFCKAMKSEDNHRVRRLFDMFDTDKSGTIELTEFIIGLSSYVSLSKDERAKFSFLMIDEDQSGFIEKDELAKILKCNFINSDLDMDSINRRVDKILLTAGAHQEQRLNFAQFMKIVNQTPGLLFPTEMLLDKLDNKFAGIKKQL